MTDQNTLTFYAALMEHIYRRDSQYDQALNLPDIAKVIGLEQLDVVNPETNTVYVKSQGDDPDVVVDDQNPEAASLGPLLTHDVYYYSERGFAGMIVQVDGKYVVVFRGTDTTLSGWSSVRAAAARDDTDSYTPNVIARPRRGRGDPGNQGRRRVNAGLPRRLRLLAMTGKGVSAVGLPHA